MYDILVNENGHLRVDWHTLVIGDAREQVAKHITYAYTGEYKENPALGGNARLMIGGKPDPFFVGNLKKQLRMCKIDADVKYRNNKVEIDLK